MGYITPSVEVHTITCRSLDYQADIACRLYFVLLRLWTRYGRTTAGVLARTVKSTSVNFTELWQRPTWMERWTFLEKLAESLLVGRWAFVFSPEIFRFKSRLFGLKRVFFNFSDARQRLQRENGV